LSLLISVFKDLFTRKNQPALVASNGGRSPQSYFDAAFAKLEVGDIAGAQEIHAELVANFGPSPIADELTFAIHSITLQKRFPGPNYLVWLTWFHTILKPRNYVEIGVESGKSLANARSPTRAIGIDPSIQIVHTQEAWVKLFKLTSDDFFQQQNLKELLAPDPLEFGFIDGLHTFDQALKDFINLERFSTPETVILFHDIFPVIPITAARERVSTLWLGDTWKVIVTLVKYRPDLKISTIPAYPSGLAVVTNLDAANDMLHNDYDRIYNEAMALTLEDYLPAMEKHLNVVANDFTLVQRLLEVRKKQA